MFFLTPWWGCIYALHHTTSAVFFLTREEKGLFLLQTLVGPHILHFLRLDMAPMKTLGAKTGNSPDLFRAQGLERSHA